MKKLLANRFIVNIEKRTLPSVPKHFNKYLIEILVFVKEIESKFDKTASWNGLILIASLLVYDLKQVRARIALC